MTEAEIQDAFTPDDYEGFIFDIAVTQTASGTWKIDGTVRDEMNANALVARYTRTLDPANFTATHDSLIVERPYRDQGFSRSLLRKCFAFYRKNGIQFVDLDAAEDGIFVWPRRGWSPIGEGLRLVHDAMRKVYLGTYGEPLPLDATLPTFGPTIIEYAIGASALHALHDADVELLPMRLTAENYRHDEPVRELLQSWGYVLEAPKPNGKAPAPSGAAHAQGKQAS